MTTFTQRRVMFLDFDEGGWSQGYLIKDGDKVVGHKTVSAKTRSSEPAVTYTLGAQEFPTAKEFIEAYEKQKRSESK